MKALKITTDGIISSVEVKRPFYRALQQELGGFEIVRPKKLPNPYCMIVDDEGLLKEQPLNLVGCILYGTAEHGQPIVGDIAIMREGYCSEGLDIFELVDNDISFLVPFFENIVKKFQVAKKEKTAQMN